MQELGDERDTIYRYILNGMLEKYKVINEKNCDVEVCIYLLKFNLEGAFTTNSLISIETPFDFEASLKAVEMEGTFENVLEFLSGVLSVKGCLCAEVGYYKPIIFFFIDELKIDEVSIKKINNENKWFQCSTKLAISFSDYSDKFKGLLGTREAVFNVLKDMDINKIEELVDVIYDIRVNSIIHPIQANFSQTCDMCDAIFRGAIDEPDEYNSESFYDFSKKQEQFKKYVAVDSIESNDSKKNADSNTDEDWIS